MRGLLTSPAKDTQEGLCQRKPLSEPTDPLDQHFSHSIKKFK